MDFEKWKCLLKAIESGSITAAAEDFGYTPSAISRMIASLESRCGFDLLLRSKHGVEPTEACRNILPEIRKLIFDGDSLERKIVSLNGIQSGTVSIGTNYTTFYPMLTSLTKEFAEEYPGITMSLSEGTSTELADAISERKLDFAIISIRKGDFDWIPICEDTMDVLVSFKNPLSKLSGISIRTFETEPFIEICPGLETDNSHIFEENQIKPNVRFTTKNVHMALSMVEADLGITLVNHLIARQIRSTAAVPLKEAVKVEIGLAVSKTNTAASAVFLPRLCTGLKDYIKCGEDEGLFLAELE